MIRAALLAAVLLVPGARVHVRAQAQADAPAAQAPQVRFSKHALARMAERGVNMSLVEQVLETRKPFPYYHQGRWKQGYYDPASQLFIATADNVVITVITDATPRYVENLKRKRPQ